MRAPADQPGSFGLACAIDELAAELGIDPPEIRRRNFATTHPGEGLPWSSNHLEGCYHTGAERIGWHHRAAAPGTTEDGDWLVGLGVPTAGLDSAPAGSVSLRLTFRRNGTVTVASSTADIGTGMRNVLAVMAADALGLPVTRITPEVGDSTLPGTDASAGGAIDSEATASMAPAVRPAAQAAIRVLIEQADGNPRSPFHGMPAADLSLSKGFPAGSPTPTSPTTWSRSTRTPHRSRSTPLTTPISTSARSAPEASVNWA